MSIKYDPEMKASLNRRSVHWLLCKTSIFTVNLKQSSCGSARSTFSVRSCDMSHIGAVHVAQLQAR